MYEERLSAEKGSVMGMLDELLPSVRFVKAVDQWLMEYFAWERISITAQGVKAADIMEFEV